MLMVLSSAQKTLGLGVVIRDDKGRVEAALCCRKITAPMGAVEAEAKAFEVGLLFAKDIYIHDVILEGVSLIVHNALCDTSPPPVLYSIGCTRNVGNE